MRIDDTTFELIIIGRVQGVGYRAWAKKNAKNLDILGWVKNTEEKSVLIEISGNRKTLNFLFQNAIKVLYSLELMKSFPRKNHSRSLQILK